MATFMGSPQVRRHAGQKQTMCLFYEFDPGGKLSAVKARRRTALRLRSGKLR
jgi:hypothetical protein